MNHDRLDLETWIQRFPLSALGDDYRSGGNLSGPASIAYIEQIRRQVTASGGQLGEPVPVDLCVWNLGDSNRRDVTKIGGVPYWPATERWPTFGGGKPYTFVAQFCFADSRDIVPNLPGDMLVILARTTNYQNLKLRWFKNTSDELTPAAEIPPSRWTIQPCHATLHRANEYPQADYEVFDEYPFPLNVWAARFLDGSKIGGFWEFREELLDLEDYDADELEEMDQDIRKGIESAAESVKKKERSFICQIGSVGTSGPQPFLNVSGTPDRAAANSDHLLTIADDGGLDFFYDGNETKYSWWSG